MFNTKKELTECLINECKNNPSFMTGDCNKHSISSLGIPQKFRSVNCISPQALEQYLLDGKYSVQEYQDSKFPNPCYLISFDDSSIVAGSGVPEYSTIPTTSCDSFLAVSGRKPGLHIYAVDSNDEIAFRDKTLVKELL